MILTIENLSKNFHSKKVLKEINIEFENGNCYGLLGNNGVGKTTLTKCIFNEYSFSGKIYLDNQPLKGSTLQKMFYFGDNVDLPKELTMFSFLQVQYLLHCGKMKDFKKRLEQENTFFKKRNIKKTLVKNLSSGEQKLLSLLAYKMVDSKIVFFDEPTANLDISNKEFLLGEIKKIDKSDKIIVIITHLVEEIKYLIDQVVILEDSQIAYRGYLPSDQIKEKFLEVVRYAH